LPSNDSSTASDTDTVGAFIERWRGVAVLPGSTELATAQSFVLELCTLLGVEAPHHAADYQFERPITFTHGDGTTSPGRIDCYKRGAFVLESKRLRAAGDTKRFDTALLAARRQAENYARALPGAEGRPPFLVVVDVGRTIELYAEFTRSGGTYVPFPDPRSHRIALADLARAELRERLRQVWDEPLALDPARVSARVTRAIAAQLAEVAKSLEASAHAPKAVAAFLSRCLFTMFAEDIGLLPKRSFADLLGKYRERPDVLARQLEILWANMDRGEFSPLLETTLLRFNGKLFKDQRALPLAPAQIDLLLEAARADWKQVEPAIFGTLLERALDPEERHALGAHYTPRAYVERLVLPTIVEPLREDWAHAQAAALVLAQEGKLDDARKEVRAFLHTLANIRVLDPACGSGNFLYVTLEHLKRLEGEVLNQLDELGDTRGRLDLAGTTVDPHQLLGIEINPRAAEIAEMVLWIGYLQWHYRTRGDVNPPEPVLKDFHNIEHRDAVLAYDRIEYEMDEYGRPVTRWDGRTMKKHPVTGEDVPDDSARMPVEKYINPRAAQWPEADFVVGNPPFIGKHLIREALGDGYVDALRASWPTVPDSADFVMYWWENAAELARAGKVRRFGLITTNSLRQTFNRRVVDRHLGEEPPLSIRFAIPDHPWVDSADGAAVRVSMTAGERAGGNSLGIQQLVVEESDVKPRTDDAVHVVFKSRTCVIHADLRAGANIAAATRLLANGAITSNGVMLGGRGFILTSSDAAAIESGSLRPLKNGNDVLQSSRDCAVIDFYGLTAEEARSRFPAAFQVILNKVKPERDQNRRATRRDRYWLFSEVMPQLRTMLADLTGFVGTPETSKHRLFVRLPNPVLPEHPLIAIALSQAYLYGILSSRLHVAWSLATGGTLEDRPRYNKSRCFETFPFAACTDAQDASIAILTEQIDAHRKRQQAQHPDLTLTGIYNVLEKLRANEPLNQKERTIHDHGLVSVLSELHDDLDRAVFDAYGWNDLAAELVGKPGATTPLPDKPAAQAAAEEELLSRLVKLNAERAAEEARGFIRWLRPDYQQKAAGVAPVQAEIETESEAAVAPAAAKKAWPKDAPAQARALADLLAAAPAPLSLDDIAARFTARGRWRERLAPMLEMLVVLGKAQVDVSGPKARYRSAL